MGLSVCLSIILDVFPLGSQRKGTQMFGCRQTQRCTACPLTHSGLATINLTVWHVCLCSLYSHLIVFMESELQQTRDQTNMINV